MTISYSQSVYVQVFKSCGRGDMQLAKPHFAKSESAIQESAKPYFAKPGNC